MMGETTSKSTMIKYKIHVEAQYRAGNISGHHEFAG